MEKVNIDFKHCFGIHELKHEFDFSKGNTVLIYAPNGVMKTSFAHIFECIVKEETPFDRINTDAETVCDILSDEKPISKESIFVVNAEQDVDCKDKISTLLASKELKDKYDEIHRSLLEEKDSLLKQIKDITKMPDCEDELIQTFKNENDDDFYSCLLRIEDKIKNQKQAYSFKYRIVFDKRGTVKKFLDKNKDLLLDYFSNYSKLIKESSFFHENRAGTSFGTYQASQLSESVADNAFFDAKHKLLLSNDSEIYTANELNGIIEAEYKKIFSDEKLKKSFSKIDSEIGKNSELRLFKLLLEEEQDIIPKLLEYDSFKQEVWYGYLHQLQPVISELLISYKRNLDELKKLAQEAKKESDDWKNILAIYKERFFVPFAISIENKDDVVLKQELPVISFEYIESSNFSVKKPREDLLNVLSRGERRAFYILQFLFEIEARRKTQTETLVILDDIADSFDYKNKYAIIEYLKDINDDESHIFKQIVLTHNFDFYRTLASRLGLGHTVFMATSDENKSIKLKHGQYMKDVFKSLSSDVNDKKFICLIPFVRNIIEYTKGNKDADYLKLTSSLHLREDSENITVGMIKNIIEENIFNCRDKISLSLLQESISFFIDKTAQKISEESDINEVLLENKFVLSIAIRLKAEKFMIEKLGDNAQLHTIHSNQTRELFEKYKKHFQNNRETLRILERVNLMTSENIHVNAFMYEPLIDMSVNHLLSLYKDINELG